jgi:hypothetical protein
MYNSMPVPICFKLFKQADLRPDSRALPNAGIAMPARTAMMAMTTNSSISVNADRMKHFVSCTLLRVKPTKV